MTVQTSALGRAAAVLCRRGAAVFPLWWADDGVCACGAADAGDEKHSRAKHPIAAVARRGCLDASKDPATVARWWARWPRANIGLATGEPSGCWVLDVDGAAGDASLAELELEHGRIPATATASTGRGRHLYFRHQTDRSVRNSARKIGEGLDVRGRGGYVVAPPSIHVNGRRYAWTADGSARVDAPAWLLELVSPTRTSTPAPSAPARISTPSPRSNDLDARVEAYVYQAVSDELDAAATAPEGARNARLNDAAFALGRFVAGGLLDEQQVRTRLVEAAERQGAWPARRLQALIDRALADAARQPRAWRDVETEIARSSR